MVRKNDAKLSIDIEKIITIFNQFISLLLYWKLYIEYILSFFEYRFYDRILIIKTIRGD